jgi:hypothetical protein
MAMPSVLPKVTLQDLKDDLAKAHDMPLPYTVSTHGSAIGPNCSYKQWGTASLVAPGQTSMANVSATFPWIEFWQLSGNSSALLETAAMGLSSLSKATGVWTPRILYSGADMVSHGYVWAGDAAGLLSDTKTPLGNRAWGKSSAGSNGKAFGQAYPDAYAPNGQGQIRGHGWCAPWPGTQFWCSSNPAVDNSVAAASNTDIAGIVWWITLRVIGDPNASFLVMPGVDCKLNGASNTPQVGERGGFNGRARIVSGSQGDTNWMTLHGTTCSNEQLAAHLPVGQIPGFTVDTPTPPPPITPVPVDVIHTTQAQLVVDGKVVASTTVYNV